MKVAMTKKNSKDSVPKTWLKKLTLFYASMQLLTEGSINFCEENIEKINNNEEVLLNSLNNKIKLIKLESLTQRAGLSKTNIKKLNDRFYFWDDKALTEIHELSKKYTLKAVLLNSKISKIKSKFKDYHYRFDTQSQSLVRGNKLTEDLKEIINIYMDLRSEVTEIKNKSELIL